MKKLNTLMIFVRMATSLTLSALAFSANGETAMAQNAVATPTPAVSQKPLRLSVLGRESFCKRLSRSFEKLGSASGLSERQALVFASLASVKVVDDLRSNSPSDFFLTATVTTDGALPKAGLPGYVEIQKYLGEVVEASSVSLVLSAAELRFFPRIPANSEVIVVAKNTASLTLERIQAMTQLAVSSNIKINVVWTGDSNESGREIEDARILAWVASATSGKFVNLGGSESPCHTTL